MIEKFKKGGTKKQGSILAQIQQLPKQQQEQVLQAFSQWAQQKGIDINQLQQDQNALEEALGMFMQELQNAQAQKARQGAKLNYIKTLKNQCAEDEEVVYYKRGGSVGCGCKKKEDGGEINKAQKGTAVENFKKSKKKAININPNDTIHVNGGIRDLTQANSPEKSDKKNIGPTGYQRLSKEEYRKMPYKDKARVDEKDEAANRKKSGGVVSKFKAAKCGTKMKKHQNGGSLNGVPFYQTGTPKGGITYPDYEQVAAQERARQREIAKQYFSQAPTLSNVYNGASAFIKSLPIIGTTATDVDPHVITGVVPGISKNPVGTTKNIGKILQWKADKLKMLKQFRKAGIPWEELDWKEKSIWTKFGDGAW